MCCSCLAEELFLTFIFSSSYIFSVELPKSAYGADGDVVLEVDTVQAHSTYPWPPVAAQGQRHFLKYETELFVLSPYQIMTQRTKIKYVGALFMWPIFY